MKYKLIFVCTIFIQSTLFSIDREQVMKDFGKKFDANRFNQEILVVHQNDRDNKYDSILVSRNNIGKYWKEINNKFGRCDYVVRQEGSDANSFLIFTDKGWEKYFIVYNSKDKISKIRFIRPKSTGPPIPPPCGY